jgi:CDK-activating kinase assembly factor MAT1
MVSPCYHILCDNCVYRIFLSGSAPCPQCGTILRKSSFHVPIFEDLRVEKECNIRKKVARCLNKREEDFENLRAYNDYLEQIEMIIFNLVNDVDVERTWNQLEMHRKENAGLIAKNQALEETEAKRITHENTLREEARIQRDMDILAELEAEEKKVAEHEAMMVDDLLRTDTPTGSQRAPTPYVSNKSELVIAGLKRKNTPSTPVQLETIDFDPLETVKDISAAVVNPDDIKFISEYFGPTKLKLMNAGGFPLDFTVKYLKEFCSLC